MGRRRSRLIATVLVLCTGAGIAYGDFAITTSPTSSAGSGQMGTQMRTVLSIRNTSVDPVTASIAPQTAAVACTGMGLTDINGMSALQWAFGGGEQRQFVISANYSTPGVRTCSWGVTAPGAGSGSFISEFNVGSAGMGDTLNVQPAAFDFAVAGTDETQIAYVQNYTTGPFTYTSVTISDTADVLRIEGGACDGLKSCAGVTIPAGSFQTIGFKCTPPPTGQVSGTITYMIGGGGGGRTQTFTCRRSGSLPLIDIMQPSLTLQGASGVPAAGSATVVANMPDSLQTATIIGTDANAFRLVAPTPPCTSTQTCTWTPAQPIGGSIGLTVECTPGTTQKTAKLRVRGTAHANDIDEADLSCVADSGASTNPSALGFGDVKVTTTSPPQMFAITNLSTTQATSVTVDTGHPDWIVNTCNASPCVIGPSGMQQIEVRFKPSAPAQNDRMLGVFVGGMQVASVALSGNGTGSRLRVTNQMSPYMIDFGTIGLAALRTRSVELEADGNRSLNVAIGTPAAPYSVSVPAVDLPAGADGMFDIRCQSATPGMFSGMVTLAPGPADHVYAADTPKLDVRCKVANTPVQLSPDELDFGEVRRNTPPPSIAIDIKNPSTSPITLDYVQLTNTTALTLSQPTDTVLDPNETITVSLTLATSVELTVSSALEVGVGGEQLVTPITGKIVTASARVTPTSLKLGSVCIGTGIDEPVKLVNSGTAQLRVQPPVMDNPFAITFVNPVSYPDTGALLSPLDEATAHVRLSTQNVGRVAGRLMWDVDAPEAPFVIEASVEVKRDGTAVSPQAIGFDQIRVDERSERRTVRLENCGDFSTAVQLLGVTASRGRADAWQLLPPQTMQMLAPGEKLSIEVFFAPKRTGPHLANIALVVEGVRQEIELTGEAVGDDLDRQSLYGCDCSSGAPPPVMLALFVFVLLVIFRRRT
ncbi:MAG: choice-of-anchor D domain-containing protein [Myxococcota bacterium]|nr:choice-of-anchor D domain-containing protein [Myxococcota bacterium]